MGREPRGDFEIVARDAAGQPAVIRNAPLMHDGTPMPTRYWLLDPRLLQLIGRLEAAGGVKRAEAEIDPEVLADAHRRYAAERDAAIPSQHDGPRPYGGVGGTRQGVKCLHTHYAWFLAGGDDPVGAWVADHLHEVTTSEARRAGGAPVVGAIDIGTNSTRLLVGDERRAVITRLGQGVDRTGRLDDAAVARTLEVLREYAAVLRAHGADRVRAVATSAARDVSNRDAFFDAAAEILGIPLELLSGEEEGRLAYLGATAELDPADGPFLVFDIGGGSTEFAVADQVLSIDTGAVRLTEQWLHSDPPTAEELSMAVSVVRAHLEDVTRELPTSKQVRTVVGLAGTVTTVAAVELGYYDRAAVHHLRLTRAQVEDVFRTLATESLVDRRNNPGLQPERADIIVGGCCILVAILRHLDIDAIVVSEADILDGIAASITG